MHIHSYWHCLKVLIEFSKNQTERMRKGRRQESGKTGGGKEGGERDGNAEKGRDIQRTDKARGCKEEKDGNERQRGASKVTKGVGGERRGEDGELLHALLYSPQPRHVFLCHCVAGMLTCCRLQRQYVTVCMYTTAVSSVCLCACLECLCLTCSLMGSLPYCCPGSHCLVLCCCTSLFCSLLPGLPLLRCPLLTKAFIHNSLIAALVSVCTDDSSPVSEAKYQTAIAATCPWGIYVWI